MVRGRAAMTLGKSAMAGPVLRPASSIAIFSNSMPLDAKLNLSPGATEKQV